MTWWGRLVNRRRLERELDAELRDHYERQVADYLAAGVTRTGRTPPGTARARGRRSDQGGVS